MKNRRILVLLMTLATLCLERANSQDLNAISGSGFNIATSFTPTNAPENTVIMGLQNQYDANYKWQFVNAYNSDNYYFRRYQYGWNNYLKIWHSGNFNPSNFLGKTSNSIGNSGEVNNFNNGYTFAYTTSGSPWNGALMSFGGLSNNYDCQLSSDYGPHGGKHISFRTRNGDAGSWNGWYEIYHSGNLNRSDVDFNTKNLYANGNIWAKEVRVALTNPWADFVFSPSYKLKTLAEVENYIKTHGHLAEIPSATEVEKNGISLGDMQSKLLQKVEELTLYVIDLKKENEQKDKQLSEQEKKYNQLEAQVQQLMKMVQTTNVKP